MASPLVPVRFVDGTEAEILSLLPTDVQWIDKAFYYPTDRTYFYRALNGQMVQYAGGDVTVVGVGCTINDKVIGGVKQYIEENDVLKVPENYHYNSHKMKVDGTVLVDGQINIF